MRETYALQKLLAKRGFARSSYFYPRARLWGADKYAHARPATTEAFERNSLLLRLVTDTSSTLNRTE